MENASKALIIAGAILLAILIISLGIMIYNQAAGIAQNNSMNELEIQQFNQKFTQYEGSEIRGSSVRALQQVVNASNAKSDNDVAISYTGSLTAEKVENGKTYTVKCDSNADTGLINQITVKSN